MPLDGAEHAGFARFRDPRALTEDDEPRLGIVREHIVDFGWHVAGVFADVGRFGWAYTIGLGDTLGLPDLVVFGLELEVAKRLLNDIADALLAGSRFEDGRRYAEFLVDVDVQFAPVLPRWNGAHFGKALDWYGSWPEMRQVVLPDRKNRMPGDDGNEAERFQLLLSRDDPAPHTLVHEHTPIEVGDGFVALAADFLGANPTGWKEGVIVVDGDQPGRAVIVSVPYVDHLVFGDEVEITGPTDAPRITGLPRAAPIATVRCGVLRGGDETVARLDDLLATAVQHEVVWEAPEPGWYFFAVPHHRFDWFEALLDPFVEDRTLVTQIVRRPPPVART